MTVCLTLPVTIHLWLYFILCLSYLFFCKFNNKYIIELLKLWKIPAEETQLMTSDYILLQKAVSFYRKVYKSELVFCINVLYNNQVVKVMKNAGGVKKRNITSLDYSPECSESIGVGS